MGTDFDDVKVKGVDSGGVDHEIGVIQESDGLWALKSNVVATIPVTPVQRAIYKNVMLKNGSTENMNVDGSSTPVNFDYAPASGEIYYVDFLNGLLYDSGNNGFNKFGTLAALTNGLVIKAKSNGTEYTIATLKDNKDFLISFVGSHGVQGNGGFAPTDSYWGLLNFEVPMTLTGDQSDYLRVTVNDDLTGIDNLHVGAHMWKII